MAKCNQLKPLPFKGLNMSSMTAIHFNWLPICYFTTWIHDPRKSWKVR